MDGKSNEPADRAGGDTPLDPGAAADLQQQLVDLLALASAVDQLRWTLRGPSASTVGPLLRSLAEETRALANELAVRMVGSGLMPNGTVPGQLISIVSSPVPGWWPAGQAATTAAEDAARLGLATEHRCARLRTLDPSSAQFLRSHVGVLDAYAARLRSC